jgi:hypothetical protein
MKVIHLLIIGVIVFVLGCSKDEYCVVKNDLLGTWVSVDDDNNYIIFKENNTYSQQRVYGQAYGFLALDTLAILGYNNTIVAAHYFEFQEKDKLFIEAFNNGQDIIYKRPE